MKRRDRKQGQVLRSWMDGHVLPAFLGRILAIDAAVAQRCAALLVPDPGSERDALIAAAALGMTVLTLLCLKAEDSCFNLRCWLPPDSPGTHLSRTSRKLGSGDFKPLQQLR
jgi:hypothetical protein